MGIIFRFKRACAPIDKHKKTTETNCSLSFTFLQRGSNGVAEARIPLKIYIMLFAQPKYKCLTELRTERQTAKQMIFCVGNGGLARQLSNIKKTTEAKSFGCRSKKTTTTNDCRLFRDPAGARTRDPNIKSVVLYLLSYGFSDSNISVWWCKDSNYFYSTKIVD